MEDIRVLDFEVKSIIHNYKVHFVDDSVKTLKNQIDEGDIVIIDEKINRLYPTLTKVIDNDSIITIKAEEKNKSYKGLIPLIKKLVEKGFRKNNKLIGIGGGITQDITAFISSIMFRGVNWIFFPTTLLAQGDSCIGSKTSINFDNYKNQIGGFYPPNKIFLDLNFLNTLSYADQQSGLGEMSHYFVIAGKKDFLEYKMKYKDALKSKEIMTELLLKSLMIKKKFIEIDEFDQHKRQIFNYGHSFGHAIESLTNYKIPHGIAVSFGMDIANYISVKKDFLKPEIRLEIRELLKEIWAGFNIEKIDINKFCNALAKDKKNVGSELRLILCKGFGKVFKAPVKNDAKLKKWITEYFKNEL